MLAQIKPYNPGGGQAVTVCTLTVERDLCVGCGICVPVCPTQTLEMRWNERLEFIPVDLGRCREGCHVCVDACPFLDQKWNEDTLARELYAAVPGIRYHVQSGYYRGLYAGYTQNETARMQGASGGLTRWFMAELIRQRVVDRVICVVANDDPGQLVRFAVLETPEAVFSAAKSAYYPTEMSEVLATVLREDARYAIVGLPCYIKGLQFAMRQNVKLARRIVLTAGLVCGQTKSKGFAEMLTQLVGVDPGRAEWLSFREKNPAAAAVDLGFQARGDGRSGAVTFMEGKKLYQQAYVTGLFKPRCCDFCDDVYAEVADVAFMDAWLPRYQNDGRGTNLVLTRSPIADQVFERGVAEGSIHLEPVAVDDLLLSQDSVIPFKRDWLRHRLYVADEAGRPRPSKRLSPAAPSFSMRRWISAAERLRAASHQAWKRHRGGGAEGVREFWGELEPLLRVYRFWWWWRRKPERYWQGGWRKLGRLARGLLGRR